MLELMTARTEVADAIHVDKRDIFHVNVHFFKTTVDLKVTLIIHLETKKI